MTVEEGEDSELCVSRSNEAVQRCMLTGQQINTNLGSGLDRATLLKQSKLFAFIFTAEDTNV